MSGIKENNERLHSLHSNGTAGSGHDRVCRVFSVDDDPDEIKHDMRHLEGFSNSGSSKEGTAQTGLTGNEDLNNSNSNNNSKNNVRADITNSANKRKNNNQQQQQVKLLPPMREDSIDGHNEDTGPKGTDSQCHCQHPQTKLFLHDSHDDTGSQHNLIINSRGDDDEEDGPSSDHASVADSLESYTLRERQHAINETHPFGIRIWKPALYKKKRSVQKVADEDIHETHLKKINWWVQISNILWSLSCGIFLFIITAVVSIVVLVLGLFTGSAREYSIVLWRLAFYLIWPFGKVVYLNFDEQYMLEDKDEGISAQQFYKWVTTYSNRLFFHRSQAQDGSPLLGGHHTHNGDSANHHTGNCRHHTPYGSADSSLYRQPSRHNIGEDGYRPTSSKTAIQRRYFGRGKWTWGRLVFYTCFHLILEPIVFIFVLLTWLMVFTIPMSNILWNLMYHFRRHPLALGFKSIKNKAKPGETIANTDRDSRSILLCTFRCAGWHYYKFTVDGTNVIVMNLVTLVFFTIFDFYALKKILGEHTWVSNDNTIFTLCLASIIPLAFYIGQAVASISAQTSMGLGAVINAFFSTVVEIFLYCVALRQGKGLIVEGSMIGSILGAVLLLPGLSMCGGALKRKTQRYNPKSASVSSTMLIFSMIVMFIPTLLYEIYGGYVIQCDDDNGVKVYETDFASVRKALTSRKCNFSHPPLKFNKMYTHVIEPMSVSCAIVLSLAYLIGLWFTLRTHAVLIWHFPISDSRVLEPTQSNTASSGPNSGGDAHEAHHDENADQESPNWSRGKSTFILLFATVLYAVIAEILVSCVDSVLKSSSLNPKFLGLTILALVPNTTEFLNAISFATHGNVALSMEIGSAYALQVCLLQIPALVLYSICYTWDWKHSNISIRDQMFALVFPKWDLVATVASVFMFTYLYAEGKSNYFKGSVLILLYVIITFGFYFQGLIDPNYAIKINVEGLK